MKYLQLTPLFAAVPLLAGDSVSSVPVDDAIVRDLGSKDVLEEPSSSECTNPWRLRAGVMWRQIGKTKVDPNLQNGSSSGNFFDPPVGPGNFRGNENRTYDDGTVGVSEGTGLTGLTPAWSYQSAGQVSGDNLIYTATGGAALDFPTSGSESEDSEIAPYIELAYVCPLRDNLELGFTLNFAVAGLDSSIDSPITQYSVTTIDTYALNGVIPPTAPYRGPDTVPGALISNEPTDREFVRTPIGTQNYLFEQDTDLYSVALGAELLWHPNRASYLSVGAGVVLNFVDWDAQSSYPTITAGTASLTTTRDSKSDSEFLFGAYLKAAAGYQFNEQWGVEGFLRYDMNEDLTGRVGPSSFEVDLSGLSYGGAVTYRF